MNIGFIGLGLMGTPMARRLLRAGHQLFLYNRTKEKARELIQEGATWCERPADVARQSDVLFSMLSTSEVLEETALGETGILSGLRPGGVHVDCSTVAPAVTKNLSEAYAARGSFFLHAPVLGSIPQATEGTLLLFVGGNEQAYSRAEPLLKILGSKIWRFDKPEQASNLKLTCNFFIASMVTTLGQALVFLKRAGIDQKKFLEILSHSALIAPMYQTKGATMIEGNFAPRFFAEHMLKDIRLLLDSANELGAALPSAEVANELFKRAVEQNLGKEDYSAVMKVLE
jgi:3-hydroxyisobutyrate dehydrogenase-like beta-hydroxyacid dehydrogenase